MNKLAETSKPTQPDIKLDKAIRNFAENLSALREFVDLISSLLVERDREHARLHKDGLQPLLLLMRAVGKNQPLTPDDSAELEKESGGHVELERLPDGGLRLTVTTENEEFEKKFRLALSGLVKSRRHQGLLYRSSLISLVSSAEWFLSQIIKQHLELNPDAWGNDDKLLSFEDLKSLGSVEDARKYLIAAKVDALMWGGFEDWFRYLTERVKLSAKYVKDNKDQLIEVFQRRNVMVHNDGLVHTSYLNKVAPALREGISVGDPLHVTPDYLSNAIDLIETNFILMGAELWKKLAPEDELRGKVLIDVAFELLGQQRWAVSGGLSLFVMNDKNLPEVSQISGTLNYWQSMKWQGEFNEIRKAVEEADFSAKDPVYQVARYALLDDTDSFFSLLSTAFRAGGLDADKLANWPIFREMRKSERYQPFLDLAHREGLIVPTSTTSNESSGVANQSTEVDVKGS